jgi:hypothetical protein
VLSTPARGGVVEVPTMALAPTIAIPVVT